MATEEFPPAPVPGVVAPSVTRSYTEGASTRGSTSSKVESEEARQKRLEWEAAEAARLATMEGQKLPAAPSTAGDVAASLATQERSGKALEGWEGRTAPDQFEGTPQANAFATVMGKPTTPVSVPPPAGELRPKTSAEFEQSQEGAGLVGGMAGPRTVQEQEDENLQRKAALEAEQAKTKEEALRYAQEMRARRVNEWHSSLANAQDQYERDAAATKKSYMEDQSWPRRILMAFAVGLGSMGSGAGARMFEQRMAQDFEMKKSRAEASLARLQSLGKQPAEIEKESERFMQDILARQGAQLSALEKQGNTLLAKYGPAKQKFNEALAAEKAKVAKMAMDVGQNIGLKAVESGWSKEAPRVTEVQPGEGKGPIPTGEEQKKAMHAESIKRTIDTIEKSPPLDNKDLKQLSKNIRDMQTIAENQTKGLAGPARVQAMQSLGYKWGLSKSLVDGLPANKQPAALAWLEATNVLIRDDSGAAITNPENFNNWNLFGPQAGEAPETHVYKLNRIKQRGADIGAVAGPVVQKRLRPAGQSPAPTPAPTEPRKTESLEPPKFEPSKPAQKAEPAKASKRLTSEQAKGIPKNVRRDYERALATKPASRSTAQNELISGLEELYGK